MLRTTAGIRIPLAGLIFCVALMTGCRSSNQNRQHKLLIYTPHGQDMLRDFVARYKQVHAEVEVQFLDMDSREVLERIRAVNEPTIYQHADRLESIAAARSRVAAVSRHSDSRPPAVIR